MRRIILAERPSPFGGRLGRHVEHDPRSRSFAVARDAGGVVLRRVSHRRFGPVLDQGSLGSCTGNALAAALNTMPLHLARRPLLAEPDAVSLYSAATRLDEFPGEYPPDDTGSSGNAVCKAARDAGLIAGWRHAFGIDDALAALMIGPVITGVDWVEGYDRPDENGLVRLAGDSRGGHEFLVRAYYPDRADPLSSLVGADQSWGPLWGTGGRGRFYMTVRDWATLLDRDGDVTVPTR